MYRGMIGSLLYLTASRPDIMYSVCLCARFQSCPKESYLSAIKRILKYLKGTMDIGLWYPKSDNFELIGFSDTDFSGCKVERKITSVTCHFLENSLVSWYSKKQNSIALSTAKVEYIVVDLCCAQILWMKQTLSDFDLYFEHVPIKCDNTNVISISKDLVQHFRTKHIEIRHHFLRDHAQKGDITLEFVSTKDQHVDIFTKPLSEEQFVDIRRQLGLISLWSNVFLMNSWWIYLLIAWISCHMHPIDTYLDNGQISTKNQNSFGTRHKKLGTSTEKGRRRITKWESAQKFENSKHWPRRPYWLSSRSDQDRSTSSSGFGVFKKLPHFSFCTIFLRFFKVSLILASKDWFECVLDRLKPFGVDFRKIGG